MLTSADALRRFLETLKDYEESIADLRHSMQRLASGDANSPELTRLPKKLHRVQTVDLQGRIHTLDTLTHELLLANIESRERVQCDTALKDVVEQVDAWVSGRHSDPSQRSRILGDMVSLLLLDAKAERVMRAAGPP